MMLDRVSNALTYRVFGCENQRNQAIGKQLAVVEKNAVVSNVWENAMQPLYNIIAMIGVLFVLIGLVMALELLNTALEAAGNAISTEYHPQIKILKDTAAGAVLVLAIAAAAVACVFFWNGEGFCRMATFFIGQPLWFLPLGFGTALSIFFIVRSPVQVAAYFRKKHKI